MAQKIQLNSDQIALLKEIEEEKKKAKPNEKLLKRLAHSLTFYDDQSWDLAHGRRNDPGGRSRSPSFGKWYDYSDAY